MLIAFEGVSGAGKTTCSRHLAAALATAGHRAVLLDELLGQDAVAKSIRQLTHVPASDLTAADELFLYAVRLSRKAYGIHRLKAVDPKSVIIADRFAVSVLAYAVYARGIDAGLAGAVTVLAAGGLRPDLSVLLVADRDVAMSRRLAKDSRKIKFIDARYQSYQDGFVSVLAAESLRHVIIDTTTRSPSAVTSEIISRIGGLEIL